MYKLMEEFRMYFLESGTKERPSVQYIKARGEEWKFFVITQKQEMVELFSIVGEGNNFILTTAEFQEKTKEKQVLKEQVKQILDKRIRKTDG